jgi:hypothetical protein
MHDTGCEVRVHVQARYRIQSAGYRAEGTGYRVRGTGACIGSWVQDTECRIQGRGDRIQGARYGCMYRQGAGYRMRDTG